MGKLHEILAVEPDLKATAEKIINEATTTFSKKAEHFIGGHRSCKMYDEGNSHLEAAEEEHKDMTTTVMQKLDYVSDAVVKYYDCIFQKENTNTVAVGAVEIGDATFTFSAPATYFLGMEKKLARLRKMFEAIPTLQPGTEWVPDPDQGEGVYKAAHDEVKHKTELDFKSRILVKPTKEHPAQIEKWKENKPIGDITIKRWSGMLSPADKSKMLGRIDKLIRAFKEARQRANTVETIDTMIATDLWNYIVGKPEAV